MDVRPPKEIRDLKPGALRRIEEYYDNFYRNEYTKALERDGRIMLDLYMKMVCVTMHDKCGMSEEEIYLFLGHHRALFQDQIKRVHSGEQVDYLNRRMEEIFKRNGFPQGFFDKMLGSVESESATEPQRERYGRQNQVMQAQEGEQQHRWYHRGDGGLLHYAEADGDHLRHRYRGHPAYHK